uniref:SGNH domain-containing protein n=1 Tax=viral metagenome TaxID=1070528 RepID=A0A6C0D2T2_9ZZZZ
MKIIILSYTYMSIHTIGDSHSSNGWTGITQHHLGPVLCYSFGKEKLNRCDIRNFDISDGDTIIFCFGEIDCRCHIHKHITYATTYQDIINNIVSSYFDAIELNIFTSQIKLKNVCVYNVVPPIQRCNVWENPEYPYLGTDEERKKYVLYFNEKIKEKCIEKKYIFFDIYDKYVDENGFLRKDSSDGNVHIENGVHLNNFIKENNI